MKLLAFDTSAEQCLVLACDDEKIAFKTLSMPRQHAEHILPMIQTVLAELALKPTQLDAIAVCTGPGSFVGIRIAVAVAQSLAYAWDLPIIPLSSLAVMAQAAFRLTHQALHSVLIDARMNQVYAGFYRAQACGIVTAICPDHVTCFESLRFPFDGDWLKSGAGWSLSENAEYKNKATTVDIQPVDLINQASELFAHQQWVSADKLLPTYLQDASIWKKQSK